MTAIDIQKIIFAKSGKKISAPIASFLRRIIHQREINEIIQSGEGLPPREFVAHALREMQIRYRICGFRPIVGQRYIIASNHPLGGLDGVILADAVGDSYIIANDLLAHIAPMREMFVPINKFGSQRGVDIERYNAALSSDKPVITFPAGLCSRRNNGRVEDGEWSSRFVKDAIKFSRKIIPVYIEGALSWRFYAIHSFRRRFGITTNLEMLLLVDEMFRQRGNEFRVVFGRPIEVPMSASPSLEAQKIRKSCYTLADMLP